MRSVAFYEHSLIVPVSTSYSQSRAIQISDEDFHVLSEFIQAGSKDALLSRCFSLEVSGGNVVIRTKNLVGAICISNQLQVLILPKITRSTKLQENEIESAKNAFLKILARDTDVSTSRFLEAITSMEKGLPIWHGVIRLFLSEMEEKSRLGFPLGYRTVKGNLPYVAGRLLFDHKSQLSISSVKFLCERDEFNQNILLNRLLKSVLFRLRTFALSPDDQRRVRRLLTVLQSVELVDINETTWRDVEVDLVTRQDYRSVVELARFVVENMSMTLNTGVYRSFSFLFNIEELFQRWIGSLLLQVFGSSSVLFQYSKLKLLESFSAGKFDYSLSLVKPDYVSREFRFVGDAKWKLAHLSSEDFILRIGDLYQITSYLVTFENRNYFDSAPASILFYPATMGSGHTVRDFQLAGKYPLKVVEIDLLDERVVHFLRSNLSFDFQQ